VLTGSQYRQLLKEELMKVNSIFKSIAIATIGWALSLGAQAGLVTCGDSYRSASLDSAESCQAQKLGSTVKAGDLTALFGGTWTQVGELTASGSNGLLSLTGSGWNSGTADGSWSIDSSFWSTYGIALITMHVGGGQKDAVDNFEWVVTPEELDGSWSYIKLMGKGGGLSNIKLWGSGTPTIKVPESGTLVLLMLGLAGVAATRRRLR
jgi:hypothetical protein